MFRDRTEAGKKLAQRLLEFTEKNPIVLAIPRGGVVVGYEISQALKAELDVIVPRKIGVPGQPELAVGAVAENGTIFISQEMAGRSWATKEYIQNEAKRQVDEIRRRVDKYRGGRPPPELRGRVVILVDDGLATGATMKAAVSSVSKRGAHQVVVAVPVGPPETVEEMKEVADRVICLETPGLFFAIGQFYEDFEQVSDEEVIGFLESARKERKDTK